MTTNNEENSMSNGSHGAAAEGDRWAGFSDLEVLMLSDTLRGFAARVIEKFGQTVLHDPDMVEQGAVCTKAYLMLQLSAQQESARRGDSPEPPIGESDVDGMIAEIRSLTQADVDAAAEELRARLADGEQAA